MSVPHPAPPVESADGLSEQPAAAFQVPAPHAVTELRKPRRFTMKGAILAGVIVVLLAGVATLAGLLIQTRGVLDGQKRQTAAADQRVRDTQAKLDATTTDLNAAKGELISAKSRLASKVTDLRTAIAAANDLEKCTKGLLDVARYNLYGDYAAANDEFDAAHPDCSRGLDEWVATAHGEASLSNDNI